MLNGNKTLYKKASDEELMVEIKTGNDIAFSELYSRYNRKVLYYFWKMLGQNEAKAQDFLQDLFMKVAERPEMFDSTKKFSTWLYSCANNMCKNEYKKMEVRRNYSESETKSKVATQKGTVDTEKFNEQLGKALNQLDKKHKAIFLLRHKQGFSIKDISDIMECSEGTVKSTLFYTVRKLSKKLSAFDPNMN